jgi:hypothetical protein
VSRKKERKRNGAQDVGNIFYLILRRKSLSTASKPRTERKQK